MRSYAGIAILAVGVPLAAHAIESSVMGSQVQQSTVHALEVKADTTTAILQAQISALKACNKIGKFYDPGHTSPAPDADGCWGTAGGSKSFVLKLATTVSGGGASGSYGPYDFCMATGTYQNGNNGWAALLPGSVDAATGRHYYTVYSTCAAQGCGSGSLATYLTCYNYE